MMPSAEGLLSMLAAIPQLLLVAPLRSLYFNGPAIMGWGGWGGMPPEDVCSQLTHVPAAVWRMDAAHMMDCEQLLERKFNTFVVAAGAAAYALLLWKLLAFFWFKYFVLRPIIAELQASWAMVVRQQDQERKLVRIKD